MMSGDDGAALTRFPLRLGYHRRLIVFELRCVGFE